MAPFNRARFTRPGADTQPAASDAELWDLVDQARAGDARAFRRFVDATVSNVYAYICRRIGDREAAEEITSDVYLAAWRALDRVRRVAASPAAWLRTIAQRRVIDYYRGRQRRNTVPVGAPVDLAAYRPTFTVAGAGLTAPPAESIYLERDQSRALWAQVQQLSADQCRVIRCRFGWGLSIEETAAALGKPPTAVKTLQYRAVRTLRQRLDGTSLAPTRRAQAAAAA